eukprot:8479326-Pyramimonas_sp.AAC.3
MMDEIGGIVELSIVPSGNMRPAVEGGPVTCQHGPDECVGNRYEACAIKLASDQSVWFPYIYCFEDLFPTSRDAKATSSSCAKRANISARDVETCAEGSEGEELAQQMFEKTVALDPPHKFVPWFVVDGQAACNESVGCEAVPYLVCQAYKGKAPAACSKYRPPSPGMPIRDPHAVRRLKDKDKAYICVRPLRRHK